MAQLLYGCGLRLNECLGPDGVKDVDFERMTVTDQGRVRGTRIVLSRCLDR